jgi:TRAP-type mannitol/chloroaromatic compound transport system substrate-binding protein
MIERRRFISKASGVAAAVAVSAVVDAPNVVAQPKIQWRMSTAYPAAADILHGAAQRLAKTVEEGSGGRFRIEVFPGGQIMLPFDCFDATSKGTIEGFMAVSSYWAAREPAMEWFQTIPFGMNPQGMAAWYHQGDGLKLWEETYAPYNVVPRPGFSNAPQMGGWFRKKIGAIGDYKGLKMRMSGLGVKVIARAGGTAALTPGSEIYAALERGVIDAAEWIGPHDDMKLGLHRTARYYYYPGWHEPGTVQEFSFNKKAYDALPVDLRRLLDHAVASTTIYAATDYHTKNAVALHQLQTEFKGKVEVLALPAPVLRDLKKLAVEVVSEASEKSPMARRVHASFTKFQALVGLWDHAAEGAYHRSVGV